MAEAAGTIVVIEDDVHIADLVGLYLRRDGFRVVGATDGATGLAHAEREAAHLVIADLALPGAVDGLEVCRRLRAGSDTPLILLAARDDEVDRVLGLELGADDYVTKPFSARALLARVHALLRLTAPAEAPKGPTTVVIVGDLEVDKGRREVRAAAGPVALTTREFDLLAFFVDQRGVALSRPQLLDGVWGEGWFGDERTVDVHVAQLRKKLGPSLPLATVWGLGYQFG
jgi:DNA-binding response OmpR family regulator